MLVLMDVNTASPHRPRLAGPKGQGPFAAGKKEIVPLGPTSADHLILIQKNTYTTVQKASPGRGGHMVFSAEEGDSMPLHVL